MLNWFLTVAFAAPIAVPVQGVLSDATGPLQGVHTVIVGIHDDAASEPVYAEPVTSFFDGGAFSAVVGASSTNDDALWTEDGERWITVTVDGVRSPAVPVHPAPRAVRAELAANAEQLGGFLPEDFADAGHGHDLADLADVSVVEAAPGQLLAWDGSAWAPTDPPVVAGMVTTGDLTGLSLPLTGSASAGTWLRGDGAWAALPASGSSIGDIRQSLLTESQFQALNGAGWVLLDGRSISGSALATLTGITTLPDGRGVVLRGKNNGRSTSTGNPDGDLALGFAQTDQNLAHGHEITSDAHTGGGNENLPAAFNQGYPTNGLGPRSFVASVGPRNIPYGRLLAASVGGNEARMRNITVNTFIRIN
jgi:hypothetical protein